MLHYNKQLANSGTFNLGLHFTHGEGYYEQYKNGQDFTDYGLNNVIVGNDTLTETDLIRRKWLDNDFYGAVFSYNNRINKLDYTIGGGWNTYDGRHYGVVRWAEYASNSQIDHIYYDNDGIKTDFNLYAKGLYQYSDDVTVYADLQHRQIDYSFLGKDENGAERNDTVNFEFLTPSLEPTIKLITKALPLPLLPLPIESQIARILSSHRLTPDHFTKPCTIPKWAIKWKALILPSRQLLII